MNELERTIQYKFKNRKLLEQSLRHKSYCHEKRMDPMESNEKLEFLGDAVLELAISEYLFTTYVELSEGDLTKFRASVVCEPMLAEVARDIHLGTYLKLSRGEATSKGDEKDSILSDGLEALIGAVFCDAGYKKAKEVVLHLLIDKVADMRWKFMYSDAKTLLQEEIQKTSEARLQYDVLEEKGLEHDKTYVIEVSHEGKVLGVGEGRSKKEAEQNAALQAVKALHIIDKNNNE